MTQADDTRVPVRRLGHDGPTVGAVGYGAMGLSGIYGEANDDESVRVLHAALDLGMTLVDTSDVYGSGHNETLVGRAIAGRRDDVVLCTKFGGGGETGLGGAQRVREAIDASLARLGVDYVDVWYLHRVDPATPVTETVGAMADVVAAGKARYLGLSEISADTLRAAHVVHPITAVQQEYSLLTRDPEAGILAATEDLGVGLVAYSPVSRGLLTGGIRSAEDMRDHRADRYPRFSVDNLAANIDLGARLSAIADEVGTTPAQLALAWVLHQGEHVVPIVGTRSFDHLRSNADAAHLAIGPDILARLGEAFPPGVAAGDRYNPTLLSQLDG